MQQVLEHVANVLNAEDPKDRQFPPHVRFFPPVWAYKTYREAIVDHRPLWNMLEEDIEAVAAKEEGELILWLKDRERDELRGAGIAWSARPPEWDEHRKRALDELRVERNRARQYIAWRQQAEREGIDLE